MKQLEDEIAAVAAKKEEAVKGQDFENAAKLRDEEKSKREAMETRKKEWADQQTKSHGAVTEDDIAAVISGWTGRKDFVWQKDFPALSATLNGSKKNQRIPAAVERTGSCKD